MTAPRLISFLFALDTERGHLFEYNKTVGQAARSLGWEHGAAVRAAARVSERPEGWEFCLGTMRTRFQWKPLAQLEKLWSLQVSLLRYLRRQAASERPLILFLEWLHVVHVLPFCLALALTRWRGPVWLWVQYRLPIHRTWRNWYLHLMHASARLWLGPGRLRLLSESDGVAAMAERAFGLPVTVAPMPHLHPATAMLSARPSPRRLLWFPGLAGQAKGSRWAERLARSDAPEAREFALAVSDNVPLVAAPGGCEVIRLPQVLPRAVYDGWLNAADLIALPYAPETYGVRTSGIFVEAVAAGKLPVTTAGTWLARELLKHNLTELIVDWGRPDIWAHLRALSDDAGLRARLARMQAVYAQFHTPAKFAQTLQEVWEGQDRA